MTTVICSYYVLMENLLKIGRLTPHDQMVYLAHLKQEHNIRIPLITPETMK